MASLNNLYSEFKLRFLLDFEVFEVEVEVKVEVEVEVDEDDDVLVDGYMWDVTELTMTLDCISETL